MKIPMHEIGKFTKDPEKWAEQLAKKRPRNWADQIWNHMRVQNISLKGWSLFKSIKYTSGLKQSWFSLEGKAKAELNEKSKLIVKFGYQLQSLKTTFWTQKKVIVAHTCVKKTSRIWMNKNSISFFVDHRGIVMCKSSHRKRFHPSRCGKRPTP